MSANIDHLETKSNSGHQRRKRISALTTSYLEGDISTLELLRGLESWKKRSLKPDLTLWSHSVTSLCGQLLATKEFSNGEVHFFNIPHPIIDEIFSILGYPYNLVFPPRLSLQFIQPPSYARGSGDIWQYTISGEWPAGRSMKDIQR